MSWVDLIGYAACAGVFATFCMSTMVPLRIVAICSNVLFVTFSALAHIYPVLVLHVVLLPVNVVRLIQALAPTKAGYSIAIAPFIIAPVLRTTKLQDAVGNFPWCGVKACVSVWKRRVRERKELMKLGERNFHDIGISRCDAEPETCKPFWQA
jgi:uncharacterized protein YjiS (DUF1127 family)